MMVIKVRMIKELEAMNRVNLKKVVKSISELSMWKFHDFSINQILREISFWDSRSAKSAIFTKNFIRIVKK